MYERHLKAVDFKFVGLVEDSNNVYASVIFDTHFPMLMTEQDLFDNLTTFGKNNSLVTAVVAVQTRLDERERNE